MDASQGHYRQTANQADSGPSYRGLRIFTAAELHEAVGKAAVELFAGGCEVVELAAGTGAMSLRLKDLGFHVTACDMLGDNFKAGDEVNFFEADLNAPLPSTLVGRFDGVVGVEIIEHLENPYLFMRQVHSLLRPGGSAIVTSPNTTSAVSLMSFARTGYFQWFDETNHRLLGHIMPISPMLMRRAAEAAGLVVERIDSIGDPYRLIRGWRSMQIASFVLERLMKSSWAPQGDVLLARLKRPATSAT